MITRRDALIAAATGAVAVTARPGWGEVTRRETALGIRSGFGIGNGVRLHYRTTGSGPTALVLLHGWPQTSFAWRRCMAPLAAAGHTVIAPDMRGFGESDKPSTESAAYDKRTVARDVLELMWGLGHERFHLVGHNIGGMVAYGLAAAYSEAVERLVLVETLIPGFGLEENMDVAQGGSWHYGFHMAPGGMAEMLTQGRERAYIAAWMAPRTHVKAALNDAEIDEYARHYAAPGGMTGGFAHYRALLADGRTNRADARRLAVPVLAIGTEHGVRDRLARGIEPLFEHREAVLIEGSGHYVAEEQPAAMTAALLRFLKPN